MPLHYHMNSNMVAIIIQAAGHPQGMPLHYHPRPYGKGIFPRIESHCYLISIPYLCKKVKQDIGFLEKRASYQVHWRHDWRKTCHACSGTNAFLPVPEDAL